MGNGLLVASIAIVLGLLGNLVALIWAASRLFTTVRFMDQVLETVSRQQKNIARDLADVEGRLRVVENRMEYKR